MPEKARIKLALQGIVKDRFALHLQDNDWVTIHRTLKFENGN